MRRSILVALVAALALALGLSSLAAAGQDGATASAKRAHKKGKKNGKGCAKGRSKSHGKRAHRSATASKKKGKGCKGGGAGWVEIGKYVGGDGVEVDIRSRKRVFVTFPGAPATCLYLPSGAEDEDVKVTAKKLTAGYVAPADAKGFVKRWSLVVTPNYGYKLVIDSDTNDLGPGAPQCDKPGVKFQGKLKKVA